MSHHSENADAADILRRIKKEIGSEIAKTADAYIIHGNLTDPDLYYASRFLAADDFTYILLSSGRDILLVSDMEKARALSESCAADVLTTSEFQYRDKAKACKDSFLGYALVLKELLRKEGVSKAAVPYHFPAFLYDALRSGSDALSVSLAKSPFRQARAVKTDEEAGFVGESVRAAEAAMRAAVDTIKNSVVRNGFLYAPGAEVPLSGADVLSVIDRVLTEHNAVGDETIVSCGEDSANPHGKTYGPLRADSPIVIDIFPMNKKTRYYGDMTRTVLKGKASPELSALYDAVLKAQAAGVKAARPGVTCGDVHNAVCDVLEACGYDTYRSGAAVGFIHSTGHGVGLEIHEMPSVSENDCVLVPGNVITIEPGLYYPGLGGIRIEDTILITQDGCRNYNQMDKIFEV